MTSLLFLTGLLTMSLQRSAGHQLCPLLEKNSKLYPVGICAGDTVMAPSDDGFERLQLPVPINVFGTYVSELYINNNGVLSLDEGIATFTAVSFPQNRRIIAPFWADVDTRFNSGNVFFRTETTVRKNPKCKSKSPPKRDSLLRAQEAVADTLPGIPDFTAKLVIIVTWYDVAQFNENGTNSKDRKRNTFQAVIVSDGRRTFSFFIYDKLEWGTVGNESLTDTGPGSSRVQIGFDNGDNNTWYSVPEVSFQEKVMRMTEVTNMNGPFMGRDGSWFSDLNLVGNQSSIMTCLQSMTCCFLKGKVYTARGGCGRFGELDYLNDVDSGEQGCPTGLVFNTLPSVCACDYPKDTTCYVT